jgi:uncharacterized surface protein with fasciclin (FAS1) repeats
MQDVPRLTQQMEYHIVPGKVLQGEFKQVRYLPTLLGEKLTIKSADNAIRVNDATVTEYDIPASNGVIHVLDAEITPPAADNNK